MSIARWIEGHAAFAPAKCALRFAGREIPYASLAARIRAAAALLRDGLGVAHGDRIAWLGLNHPDMIVLLFAAARIGAIFLPLNARLAPPEHRFILGNAGVTALFVQAAFADRVAAVAPDGCAVIGADFASARARRFDDLLRSDAAPGVLGADEDPVLLVYTSGTTGRPKGAVLGQRALLVNAINAQHMHDLTAADHVLTVLPMFHVGGLNIQTVPALHAGATVTIHARFDPALTLGAIAADKPTLTVQVPATLQALLEHADFAGTDLSSLRAITTGSTDVPVGLIEAFHARGVPVIQVYGATETGPLAIYQRISDAVAGVGTIGRSALHCDIRIVDETGNDAPPGMPGEILVRGANVASGYWNDPRASSAAFLDGYFRTGDIAECGADGVYRFKDRIKNVIISGGENVYPAEIERVLRKMPGIAEAAVVGRADARWGQVPVAVVAARRGAVLSRERLLASFEGVLARYKHPRDVILVDSLPRNAMGKVDLEAIRSIAEGRAGVFEM
jgi:fatty-acyl-CoA synthase